MNRATLFLALVAAVAPAAAQSADFNRIRERSDVTLVLATGGECYGRVARRMEGALSVMLTASSRDCGVRGRTVSVRRDNTQAVERETPAGATTRRKTAAVATALAVGLVIPHLPPTAILGVAAAGLETLRIMNRDIDRPLRGGRYVIYVSKLAESREMQEDQNRSRANDARAAKAGTKTRAR
jgi:hypothetical protein